MNIRPTQRCACALVIGIVLCLLPGAAGLAADTDLFRTNAPPNILLMVDNSSSMSNAVVHTDFFLTYNDPVAGPDTEGKNQQSCTFWRDLMAPALKFKINVVPKRQSYKDSDDETMRYRGTPKAWEFIPILHPDGSQMFDDIDEDGNQDVGEIDLFYRFPDPTKSNSSWLADTDNEHRAILDAYGNHLFWDQNGDTIQTLPAERDLYYEWNTNTNKVKGKAAKIVTRITPVTPAIQAGVDPMTLDLNAGGGVPTICGVSTAGMSLWDGDDPLAATPSGVVVKIQTNYLDFLFSVHGATIRDAVFAPTFGNDGLRPKASCVTLIGPESLNYETYRRSRVQALSIILRTVICEVNQVGDVRFGFAQFRFAGKGGDDNGGYVAVPIEHWFESDGVTPHSYSLHGVTDTHENHLRRVIRTATPDAQTPLAESLFQLYTYFMPREADEMPEGRDVDGTENGHVFPVYNYDTSLYNPLGGYDSDDDEFPPSLADVGGKWVGSIPPDPNDDADASAAPDPVLYSCQKNFVLFITDGGASGDDFTDNDDKINAAFNPIPLVQTYTDLGYNDDHAGFPNFQQLIGDHYRNSDGTPDETEETSGTGWQYFDDVAYFMNRHDFRPDLDGDQTIDTYTVGYSLESGGSTILSHVEKAALRGNGLYFESADTDQLAIDIVSAITDMIDKAQAFTSATVPASRTTDGDNFYSSYFLPKSDSPWWEGHLKNFGFSAQGDILTSDGRCATGNDINAYPPCLGGALRTFEDQIFWDAADAIPAPLSRKLYVESGATPIFSQPATVDITPGSEAAVAAVFGLTAGVDDAQAPYDSLIPNTPGDMAVALVDSLKGCEWGSSPCVPRTNDAGSNIYLGDIFHSNPIVVGSPNQPINENSYHTFATTYRTRERVIYAGADDGFMHGFHAGTWETIDAMLNPVIPPRHNRGSGEELFGFMPYAVRDVIKELPKQTSFPRAMETVDGSPAVGDVWFHRNLSGADLTTVNPLLDPNDGVWQRWRTVLISGLRNGGKELFALDVTDPPATASAATSAYPRYLWGFPCEDCANAVNGTGVGNTASESTYMGYTWSEPVITRVKVHADGGPGVGYDRWVAIFGGGYHPYGDPNGSDYKQSGDVGFTPEGRAIYMVDITTGKILAKKHFDAGATALADTTVPQVGIKEFNYAFASAPAVFDLDFDGYADVIYIGDLGGNVWKWVVRAIGDDPINNTVGNKDPKQPNWPFRRFFRAGTSLEPSLPAEQTGGTFDISVHYQSFFFPPTGAKRGGKLILAFGAGERANPKGPPGEYADGDDSNNNHYYVVRDSNPMEVGLSLPHPITESTVEADLADFDALVPLTCAVMQTTKQGYFITGRDAEKFITNSVIFLGDVFTGSFLPPDPSSSADVCAASGSAFLYAFGLDCGDGIFTSDPGDAADQRRRAIGSGIPTRPRVSVGELNQGGSGSGDGGPCANRVVMITSDGFVENDCPGSLPSMGVKVRSWRER